MKSHYIKIWGGRDINKYRFSIMWNWRRFGFQLIFIRNKITPFHLAFHLLFFYVDFIWGNHSGPAIIKKTTGEKL